MGSGEEEEEQEPPRQQQQQPIPGQGVTGEAGGEQENGVGGGGGGGGGAGDGPGEQQESESAEEVGEAEALVRLYRRLVLAAGRGCKAREQGRRRLVTTLQQQLTTHDHQLWQLFPEAWRVIEASVTGRRAPAWQPHAAMTALRQLEHMVWNLWDEPWKRELDVLKTHTGFFQYKLSAYVEGVLDLCGLMGYVSEAGDSVLRLERPGLPQLSHAAVVILLCFTEFSIYQAVYDLVYKTGGTLLDVYQCRLHHIVAVEDCVQDIVDRYDSVVRRKAPAPGGATAWKVSGGKESRIKHFLLRKSHSEDRHRKVAQRDFPPRVYGFPSVPSNADLVQAATQRPPAAAEPRVRSTVAGLDLGNGEKGSAAPALEAKAKDSPMAKLGACLHSADGKTSKMHNLLNKFNRIKPDLRATPSGGSDGNQAGAVPLWPHTAEEKGGKEADPAEEDLQVIIPENTTCAEPVSPTCVARKDSSGCASYWAQPTFSTFKPSK